MEKKKLRGFERLPIAEIFLFGEGKFIRIPKGRKPKARKRELMRIISIRLPQSLLKKIETYKEGDFKERSHAIRYLLSFAFHTLDGIEKGLFFNREELEEFLGFKESDFQKVINGRERKLKELIGNSI